MAGTAEQSASVTDIPSHLAKQTRVDGSNSDCSERKGDLGPSRDLEKKKKKKKKKGMVLELWWVVHAEACSSTDIHT